MTNGTDQSDSRRAMVPAKTAVRARRPQLVALCNECGSTRATTDVGSYGEPLAWGDPDCFGDRCLVRRRCAPCGRRTLHAYIRPEHDQHRDYCELEQARRDDERRRELMRLEHLRERVEGLLLVDIRVRDEAVSKLGAILERADLVAAIYRFDDAERCLLLRRTLPPEAELRLLKRCALALLDEQYALWNQLGEGSQMVLLLVDEDVLSFPAGSIELDDPRSGTS